jgi:hypothetical protein
MSDEAFAILGCIFMEKASGDPDQRCGFSQV